MRQKQAPEAAGARLPRPLPGRPTRFTKASDPKVESTFGIDPMLLLLVAHRLARKTGSTFPHDAQAGAGARNKNRKPDFSGFR